MVSILPLLSLSPVRGLLSYSLWKCLLGLIFASRLGDRKPAWGLHRTSSPTFPSPVPLSRASVSSFLLCGEKQWVRALPRRGVEGGVAAAMLTRPRGGSPPAFRGDYVKIRSDTGITRVMRLMKKLLQVFPPLTHCVISFIVLMIFKVWKHISPNRILN